MISYCLYISRDLKNMPLLDKTHKFSRLRSFSLSLFFSNLGSEIQKQLLNRNLIILISIFFFFFFFLRERERQRERQRDRDRDRQTEIEIERAGV